MTIKEEIEYNDFSKLDIRIGEIIDAKKIENSNKLIKIIFDFGDFKRQILAGIGTKYTAEELIGKKMPVIVNIKARKMMGFESYGMILACGEQEVEALLFPDNNIENGSQIN
jgi:methionine--tRNA ligase beta chain